MRWQNTLVDIDRVIPVSNKKGGINGKKDLTRVNFPEYNWIGLDTEEEVVPYKLIATMTSLLCRSS